MLKIASNVQVVPIITTSFRRHAAEGISLGLYAGTEAAGCWVSRGFSFPGWSPTEAARVTTPLQTGGDVLLTRKRKNAVL